MNRMMHAALLAGLLTLVGPAAQAANTPNADDYRGGWESDPGAGAPHVLEFSIRAPRVRGIYCSVCHDATTLAFIDGSLGADGLTFTITHVRDDGTTAFVDHASAQVENGKLHVRGTSGQGGHFDWVLRKDPRGPAPVPGTPVNRLPAGPPVMAAAPARAAGAARRPAPPPYVQPGPWETLTPAKVVGVWLGFGVGIDKQFFIFRRVGNEVRGMVCGRCDNPYTMAALDDVRIEGDTLHFNILHEDWGPGTLPSHNQVTAHISQNEMRLSTELNNTAAHGVQGFEVHASLLGPVSAEATHLD
ncbi:MAG TPA: hypothetical protein VMF64_04245 [Steroidobacteraceae bacterium]|nr:hypothetical protein [Steroidobacteraceae bacterium]